MLLQFDFVKYNVSHNKHCFLWNRFQNFVPADHFLIPAQHYVYFYVYLCGVLLIYVHEYLIFSLFVLCKMLNNVVNWDIKINNVRVHGQKLSCDIMNLSRYFTYLVMCRPFLGQLCPSLSLRHNRHEKSLNITWYVKVPPQPLTRHIST